MIITCHWNKLCSIGTKVWELWTSGPIVADGGAGVDDEGMSSAEALAFLLLDAIYK